MIKLFFTLLPFLIAAGHAQYILIPDSNFRHALISEGYSSCFDISQTMLHTTCSKLLDSTTVNVYSSNISSVEGVQYFKHLISFNCNNNHLTLLPSFPNTLSQLYADNNNITVLPHLPPSLTNPKVENNPIAAFPLLPTDS